MLAAELLKAKGAAIFSCAPKDTLAWAVAQLDARRVGALVVVEDGRAVGVISERDLVRAIAHQGAEALAKPVREVMTAGVVYAYPHETVEALMARMTDRRVRHLPILVDGGLAGVLSIGDLVKAKIAAVEHEAQTLKAYISAG